MKDLAPGDADSGGRALEGIEARDLARFQEVIGELKNEETIGLPALSVVTRELSTLSDRIGRGLGVEDRR